MVAFFAAIVYIVVSLIKNRKTKTNETVGDRPEETDTSVKICPFCGKANKIDDRFCRGCGKELK